MKPLVEGLRFLSELLAVVTAAVAGFDLAWRLGVLLPLIVIFTWSRWVAPKAPRRVDDPVRLVIEVTLFAVVGALAAAAGREVLGAANAAAGVACAAGIRSGLTDRGD